MSTGPHPSSAIEVNGIPPRGPMARALGALLRSAPAVAGLIVLGLFVLIALFAPLVAPGDPFAMVAMPFMWPGTVEGAPLGTDALGRDLFVGLIHGARASLIIGFSATFVGLLFGTLVGACAGYWGGKVDLVLVRLIELFQTIPGFVLVVVLVALVQPSILTITLAIAIVSWPPVARLVRAEFRALAARDFVVAARAAGCSDMHIMLHEILPNALPPVVSTTSVMVASAILMESALSFLGMGDPNMMSWGGMIGAGRDSLRSAWYVSAIPGLAIVLVVLALNFLGEGVEDALDPRRSGGQL